MLELPCNFLADKGLHPIEEVAPTEFKVAFLVSYDAPQSVVIVLLPLLTFGHLLTFPQTEDLAWLGVIDVKG